MVARSWADRLAQLPLSEEEIVDGLARAIYSTHWRAPAPGWEKASEDACVWVKAQARESLVYLRALTRPSR
jgi:hypothetical protein